MNSMSVRGREREEKIGKEEVGPILQSFCNAYRQHGYTEGLVNSHF